MFGAGLVRPSKVLLLALVNEDIVVIAYVLASDSRMKIMRLNVNFLFDFRVKNHRMMGPAMHEAGTTVMRLVSFVLRLLARLMMLLVFLVMFRVFLFLAVLTEQLSQLFQINFFLELGEKLLGAVLVNVLTSFELLEQLEESFVRLDTILRRRILGRIQIRIEQQIGRLVNHVGVLVDILVAEGLQERVVIGFYPRRLGARTARAVGYYLDLLLHRRCLVIFVFTVQCHLENQQCDCS